jgi:AsmA-like protein
VIRTRRWVWLLTGLAAGLAIALVIVAATVPLSSNSLRRRIVSELSRRMNADVELGDLDIHLFPRLRASGESLRVRQHGDGDEPLISVQHFAVDADLAGLMRKRVAHVQLVGLRIVIPPRHHSRSDAEPIATSGQDHDRALQGDLIITAVDSDDAQLVIQPGEKSQREGKKPNVWAIHRLHMSEVGAQTAMPFRATLTNAIPPGEIVTSGTFGPWHAGEPGDTPLDGKFTFDRADLSVFHGIGGTLSSRGGFGGSLDYIDVNGETETPDFVVNVGGHPFALHTKYHAIVDGTNGDTELKRIEASFLKSSLVASGGVYDDSRHAPGRFVQLDIQMDRARIEDVMMMAVKTPKAPMTGALKLQTKFLLTPGESDVPDRLRLDGHFSIGAAHFTNIDVQAKINELSQRSRGRAIAEDKSGVLSNFAGQFKLANGKLTLPALSFDVPGAEIHLAGAYALRPETLDFRGTMFMDAKISQTQSGFKRILLKVVDPLFRRKDGKDGSAIPFKINGQRKDPQFGLDFGRVFKR